LSHGSLSLDWIRRAVENNTYIITRHAEVERRNDALSLQQVEEALRSGVALRTIRMILGVRLASCSDARVGARSTWSVGAIQPIGWSS